VCRWFGGDNSTIEDLDPDALLANSLSRDMLDAISIIDTASHAPEPTPEAEKEMVSDIETDNAAALDFDLGLSEAEIYLRFQRLRQLHLQQRLMSKPMISISAVLILTLAITSLSMLKLNRFQKRSQ
jgi:hypothetical protein